ncbi:sugar diacid recognition domain-containing protein [Actinomadura sp. NPDC047616]|uniref:CdaR family transcriptional regulator n=1 Tax=Actinomadura sp. NPDC047616 TaxID=3155914 RepID=UPI0033DD9A22
MISAEDARAIVAEITRRLGRNVNIMDRHGVIIASGDPARVGEVHEGARRVLATGEPFAVTGAEARRLGGTQAGVNLPIRAARDGGAGGEAVAGVVGVTGEPREVGELAAAVVLMTELMITQRALREEAGWRRRVREQILADLVAGRLTAAEWRRRLRLVDARPGPPSRAFALRAADPAATRDLDRRLGADERRVLAAVDADGVLWAVAAADAAAALRPRLEALRAELPGGALLDAGDAADLTALTDVLTRARLALRRPWTGRRRLDDLELPVLLARVDETERAAMAGRVLGALPGELRRTLRAYLDHDRDAAAAARALNVHRNTLAYRLTKIADLTGRDPRRFTDAVTLRVALDAAETG